MSIVLSSEQDHLTLQVENIRADSSEDIRNKDVNKFCEPQNLMIAQKSGSLVDLGDVL